MPETDRLIASVMREGDILADKYRVERVLGSGGMGMVVAARHLQLDEQVAIKFLLPSALEMPDAVERFMREAKAAVRIRSEHVVRVFDVGTLERGAPYMVMEYLRGTDLSEWLKRHENLTIADAVDLILQVLEAVADAHAVGIIHRDLKPSNLFCVHRPDGLPFVKVLDFGISKLTDYRVPESQMAVTAPAAVMGSPLYMSPEQMRSARDVDTRTDIWAIGVILYEMFTGNSPFDGTTLSEVCVKAASIAPPSIRERCPSLPAELEAVVLRCLKKDPNERYENVAELARELLPFASERIQPAVERVSRITTTLGGVSAARQTLRSSDHVVAAGSVPTVSSWRRKAARKRVNRLVSGVVIGACVTCATLLVLARFGKVEVTTNASLTPSVPEVSVATATIQRDTSDADQRDVATAKATPPTIAPVGAPSASARVSNSKWTTPGPNGKSLNGPKPALPSAVPGTPQRHSAARDLFAGPQ
jgi:serine/threonine-protein kinase